MPTPPLPSPPAIDRPLERLIVELREAAVDSTHPDRFESAIARAFEELGFGVTQLGDAGDTDVLLAAEMGQASYSVVVDGKSRKAGKVDQLEVLSLKDHQTSNRADHAVVIAGTFGGGKVAAHARDQGVTLLPVAVLEEWLRLHHRRPQDLLIYRKVFALTGLVERLPAELVRSADDGERWQRLLTEIVDLIKETYDHGLDEPLPAKQVFAMLVTRLKGVIFPEKEVARAMELLSHPAVGALTWHEDGYVLVMSRETVGLRLRRLADGMDTADTEPA